MADNARRVGLYSRPEHHQKVFFAFARGVFPVHEICGALTAMQLAKRNVLGKPVPLWRLLLPAVALHAMGNFRGKKPLFKVVGRGGTRALQTATHTAPPPLPTLCALCVRGPFGSFFKCKKNVVARISRRRAYVLSVV
jgi:hypothetical protein